MLSLGGCGYEPVYGGERPGVRLSVRAAPYSSPHVEVVEAAVSGVRRALGAGGVLKAGQGYPRVVVEVVRVDEQAAGVRASDGAQPLARGATVAVVGRAWVEESQAAPPSRDTGEVRRSRSFASGSVPSDDQARYSAALRAAGHELGQALGHRVLGAPEVTYEPM